jgi:hypothetical protein
MGTPIQRIVTVVIAVFMVVVTILGALYPNSLLFGGFLRGLGMGAFLGAFAILLAGRKKRT